MAIFDALDGPQHATLRHAVRDRRRAGRTLVALGLVGLAVLLATSDEQLVEAATVVVIATLLGATFWSMNRRTLREALTAPPAVTDRAIIDDSVPPRRFLRIAAFAVLLVVGVAIDAVAPMVGVVLAMGVVELLTAHVLHGWERRHHRTLLAVGTRLELYAR